MVLYLLSDHKNLHIQKFHHRKNNETMMLYEHKNIQYTNFYKQHEACAP